MDSKKYIGMDVHKESISIAVRNDAGKILWNAHRDESEHDSASLSTDCVEKYTSRWKKEPGPPGCMT